MLNRSTNCILVSLSGLEFGIQTKSLEVKKKPKAYKTFKKKNCVLKIKIKL